MKALIASLALATLIAVPTLPAETEGLSEVSDDMRQLIEQEWPELVHKLPPKASSSG